MTKVIAQ